MNKRGKPTKRNSARTRRLSNRPFRARRFQPGVRNAYHCATHRLTSDPSAQNVSHGETMRLKPNLDTHWAIAPITTATRTRANNGR
jgi:hypothetical protein